MCASSTFCVAKTTAPPRPVTPPSRSQSRARCRGSSARGGLVEEDDRRVGDEADGDVQALHVADRELLRGPVRGLEQVDRREQPLGLVVGLRELLEPANSRRFSRALSSR